MLKLIDKSFKVKASPFFLKHQQEVGPGWGLKQLKWFGDALSAKK